MSHVESAPLFSLTDLVDRFGPMPAWRIPNMPAPGTATEQDVVNIEEG